MRSQAVLTAILATIARLESIEAVPLANPEPATPLPSNFLQSLGPGPVISSNFHEADCPVEGCNLDTGKYAIAKRSPVNWVKIGEDGLGSLVSSASSTAGGDVVTAVENEAKSLYSQYARRSVEGTVVKDVAKEGESLLDKAIGGAVSGGASTIGSSLVNGAEDLWDDVTGKSDDSGSSSKRSAGGAVVKEGESLLDKALGGAVSGGASTIGSSLVNGAEDLWDDITGDSSNSKRGWGSLLGSVGKGLGTGALETGAEDIWDDLTGDSSNTKRGWASLLGSVGKGLGTGALETGAEDLWDDITGDSSSSSKRAVPAQHKAAVGHAGRPQQGGNKQHGGPKHSATKTTHPKNARSFWTSAGEGLLGGAAKEVGGDLMGTMSGEIGSVASDISSIFKERDLSSETLHAPVARSSFLSEVEHVGEEALPFLGKLAGGLFEAAEKRSTGTADALAARSSILSEVEHGVEDVLPILGKVAGGLFEAAEKRSTGTADALAARSSILNEIEHVGEEALPILGKVAGGLFEAAEKRSTGTADALAARSSIINEIEHVGEAALPFVGSFLSDLKRATDTLHAPVARSSGVVGDIEEGLGDVVKYGAKYIPEILEDI